MADRRIAPLPSSGRQSDDVVHVMHLIPRYVNDGTCRLVNSLVKFTDRRRFRIFVGILSRDEVSTQPLVDMGAVVVQLDMTGFADLSATARLARQLRDNGIQILHTHRIRPDLVGRISGRWAGVPINVSTQHFTGEWDERGRLVGWLVRLLYRLTLPLTQKIVNISRGEMEVMEAEGVPPAMMQVIHNGTDGEIFFPAGTQRERAGAEEGERPPVVGCVAFLSKRKGINYLIDAFRHVADRHPGARLEIVGDGAERSGLQQQIDALGLERNVTLMGNQVDVPRLMNGFDVVALPSVWEPFGLVVAEAMACGKPVVATNVGGIPEIVEHGRTGLLVPPAKVEPLAEALSALLESRELRTRLGEAGRQRFLEAFDSRIMAARYQAMYESLLNARMPVPGAN